MVHHRLLITADTENVHTLEPMGGVGDLSFTFHFKLKYENCGDSTEKPSAVSLDVEVPLPGTTNFTNLVQKCKGCDRVGTVKLIRLNCAGPLTGGRCQSGSYSLLMGFHFCGLMPYDFSYIDTQWRVQADSGMVFENVDLSDGDWAGYDEEAKMPVTISNLRSRLLVLDPWVVWKIANGRYY